MIQRLFARHNYQPPTHRCGLCGASKNAPAFGARDIDCPNCARYGNKLGTMEFIRGGSVGRISPGVTPHRRQAR